MTPLPTSYNTLLAFRVYGVPQPKGSTRAFLPKGSRFPVVTSANAKVKPWAQEISGAAASIARGLDTTDRAISVQLDFYLSRPASAPKRVWAPIRKPDLDKLVRAVLDALTGIAWRDDAQVVSIQTTKRFATPVEPPGVSVSVSLEGNP
jgi:crossover junction endodeoxyribonuclease RusA